MLTCFKTTKERLAYVARTLATVDYRRARNNDPSIGRGIESFLVGRELRELEHEDSASTDMGDVRDTLRHAVYGDGVMDGGTV
jgi:hypothetical protein